MKTPTLAQVKTASRTHLEVPKALELERRLLEALDRPATHVFAVITKTLSEANRRFATKGGMYAKAARVKQQRALACFATKKALRADKVSAYLRVSHGQALEICLKRHAPSDGLDDDNLRSALKAVRDGIAEALGIDDGARCLVWSYQQARTPKGVYFVTVALCPSKGVQ